ncbi:MAG: dienelactone hydrolase-like enzyme [Ilumatobacteraceae bacterium]|nr:dienelactone hydrolase-like enzyme [Ilumatobacteraceae bacterium]
MRTTLPSGTTAEIATPAGPIEMGLVIAPDIFGLRPLYDDLVARLAAEWSMVVCAVEPFPGLELGPEIEPRFAAVPMLDDDSHLRDLFEGADAVAAAAVAAGAGAGAGAGAERIGLLGFCLGGMYCHKAARSDRFARIVSFYGMIRVPDAWHSPTQGQPLDHLATGHPDRDLAIIGERDSYTPPDDVAALAAAGVTVVRYPEAEHGFAHDPSRPAHRAADAHDAFTRARDWLTAP